MGWGSAPSPPLSAFSILANLLCGLGEAAAVEAATSAAFGVDGGRHGAGVQEGADGLNRGDRVCSQLGCQRHGLPLVGLGVIDKALSH